MVKSDQAKRIAILNGWKMEDYYHLIKRQYINSKGDSIGLFKTILAIAEEIGLDQSLAYLEQCVSEKRLAWLDCHQENFGLTEEPIVDAYRLFYEAYLGVSVPDDGMIVEQTEHRIVMRWWNSCPTLTACQELGLDTREICRKAYHQPVQAFLSILNPKLRFDRKYEALRPFQEYCEETITLEE